MAKKKKAPIDLMAFVKQNAQFFMILGLGTGGLGGSHLMTSSKIDENAAAQTMRMHIQDSTQRAHWREERTHKDSLQTASDSIAAIKDDLILRKLDTTIQWQKLHSHNR